MRLARVYTHLSCRRSEQYRRQAMFRNSFHIFKWQAATPANPCGPHSLACPSAPEPTTADTCTRALPGTTLRVIAVVVCTVVFVAKALRSRLALFKGVRDPPQRAIRPKRGASTLTGSRPIAEWKAQRANHSEDCASPRYHPDKGKGMQRGMVKRERTQRRLMRSGSPPTDPRKTNEA